MGHLQDSGRATRFKPGHRLSVGNRGGRPRKELTDKLNRYSEFALDALYQKARDPGDSQQWDAIRELARLTTPRRREVTGDAGRDLGLKLSVGAFREIAAEAMERAQAPAPDESEPEGQ